MKYFAAIAPMKDKQKSEDMRTAHLAFLEEQTKQGNVLMKGRFVDGAGGLVIYQAESLEEVEQIAAGDPYVTSGARDMEIHEWDMQTEYNFSKK